MKFKFSSASKSESLIEVKDLGLNCFQLKTDSDSALLNCTFHQAAQTISCRKADSRLEENVRIAHSSFRSSALGGFGAEWSHNSGMKPWQREQQKALHCAPGQDHRQSKQGSKPMVVESPLTGNILKITQQNGSEVQEGELIMVIEAMKMENQIIAPIAGRVENLDDKVGNQVSSGSKLFKIIPQKESAE